MILSSQDHQVCRLPARIGAKTGWLTVGVEEFIRGFQVFDKEGTGFIGAGELRYALPQLREKMRWTNCSREYRLEGTS